jgi:hypothetical protein
MGDGQGNCNLTRTAAAEELAEWLATDPTGSGDSDVLIIGDLNSYAKEDPIVALQDAGYTDLVADFGGPDAYGYVFDGQLGYLDHALANASLYDQVAGVVEWHINADEVPLFDYNDDERTADEAAFEEESDTLPLYEPNEFRTSDHDPILVGLNLTTPDTTAPTVTIEQASGQPDPTNSSPINFTVVFSEPVTGFDDSDVVLGGTAGATTANVTESAPNDGTTYNVAVSGMTGGGTVTALIPADAAQDAANNGNTASTSTDNTVTYNPTIYDFEGFFPPVDNPPILNSVKAGSAVPLKFSLGGDYGLDIFAPGYPASRVVSCDTGEGTDPIEETVSAGNSGLQYDPSTGIYTYVWKTTKGWAGCREIILLFDDGTVATALFKFKR